MFNRKIRLSYQVLILLTVLTASLGCRSSDNTQDSAAQAPNGVLAVPALLATISDDEKPDVSPDVQQSAKPDQENKQPAHIVVELNKNGRGSAYIARVQDGVRVVHNGRPGKTYEAVEQNTLTLSSNGQRVAYGAKVKGKWLIVDNGSEYGPYDDKGPPVFSPDGRHIAYEAKIGDYWYVYVDKKKSEWAPSYYEKPAFNKDSTKVMLTENTKDSSGLLLAVSDLNFKHRTTRHFKGAERVISPDLTRVAYIENSVDFKRVIDFTFNNISKAQEGAMYREISNVAFSNDGSVLVYIAKKDGKTFLVMNGREEQIPDGEYPWAPVVRPDAKGAGIIIVGLNGAFLHQAFYDDKTKAGRYKECADLTYNADGKLHAYVAIKNEKFTIVVNGKEGPFFDRTISPQFSPDGNYLVYRARQDGKRFVVVADTNGTIIRQHPGYERVFETTFTEDGKSVAYGAKDGKQLLWKVENLP